jgi:non-homologous end joining protein Ku
MHRAYWKGYLRLSLVTCPIELFPATSQAEKTHSAVSEQILGLTLGCVSLGA